MPLIFLNCPEQGLTPTERHWQPQELTGRPQVLWENVLTGKWHSTSPVLMWGQGHACVFSRRCRTPSVGTIVICEASGPPGPKDEEAVTGRLSPGKGTTEADSSANQRAAKEMTISKIDAEQ
jgi:hypothetical protein